MGATLDHTAIPVRSDLEFAARTLSRLEELERDGGVREATFARQRLAAILARALFNLTSGRE